MIALSLLMMILLERRVMKKLMLKILRLIPKIARLMATQI